jgi:hypothetical protein
MSIFVKKFRKIKRYVYEKEFSLIIIQLMAMMMFHAKLMKLKREI